MRASTLLLTAPAIVLVATAALAFVPSPTATPGPPPEKRTQVLDPPNPIHIDQAGDTIASALPITSVPFSDSGTTAGYVDDYSPNCGFAGGAPDVVYRFSPTSSAILHVVLCGSAYDTEVYVYQDTQGNIVGCNDDSCGLQSELSVHNVSPGHTYYIIVDGYSNASGAYQISVAQYGSCYVVCRSGALLEGEPACQDNYYDSYNGGCNSAPPVFESLPCSDTPEAVCGTYGGFFYAGLSYRDTDWYQIVLLSPRTVTWTVRGESDTLLGIINGNAGCPASAFYVYTYGGCATDLSVTSALSPGTWWLFVSTLNFGTVAGPCGMVYEATLSGYHCEPLTVKPVTWGRIKNMYK